MYHPVAIGGPTIQAATWQIALSNRLAPRV